MATTEIDKRTIFWCIIIKLHFIVFYIYFLTNFPKNVNLCFVKPVILSDDGYNNESPIHPKSSKNQARFQIKVYTIVAATWWLSKNHGKLPSSRYVGSVNIY